VGAAQRFWGRLVSLLLGLDSVSQKDLAFERLVMNPLRKQFNLPLPEPFSARLPADVGNIVLMLQARPLPPSVLMVGPMLPRSEPALPTPLRDWLDSPLCKEHGVALVSTGSTTVSLTNEETDAILAGLLANHCVLLPTQEGQFQKEVLRDLPSANHNLFHQCHTVCLRLQCAPAAGAGPSQYARGLLPCRSRQHLRGALERGAHGMHTTGGK